MVRTSEQDDSANPAKHRLSGAGQDQSAILAEDLMSAAHKGENLMRAVDYMSSHDPKLKQDVIAKMIDLQNAGKFPDVHLVDFNGNPVTNDRLGVTVGKILQTAPDGHQIVLYDGSAEGEARTLMNASNENPLVRDRTTGAHPEDTAAILASFKQSIADMEKRGKRLPGGGTLRGIVNDALRAYKDPNMFDCADQSTDVLNDLAKLKLKGNWDFHLVGDPPHYTVEVVPHSKDDPLIRLDPWRGEDDVEVVPPGTFTRDTRLNRWVDDQGRARWT